MFRLSRPVEEEVGKMVIVRLKGGLGNQMFQYAAGRRLAHATGGELKLDASGYENNKTRSYGLGAFNIIEAFASKEDMPAGIKFAWLPRKGPGGPLSKKTVRRVEERHFHFDPGVLSLPDGVYLDGYWQSEKYFSDIRAVIRKEFTVKAPQAGRNREIAASIGSCVSVSVHVRRGDYISDPKTSRLHDVCGLDYYRRAIDLMAEKAGNPRFFIFSDDPEWVRKNMNVPYPAEFVDFNGPDNACEDLRLMSQCSHNIIANSSLSWWGAWLNPNPGKIVLAPERWLRTEEHDYSDVVPEGWVKL